MKVSCFTAILCLVLEMGTVGIEPTTSQCLPFHLFGLGDVGIEPTTFRM